MTVGLHGRAGRAVRVDSARWVGHAGWVGSAGWAGGAGWVGRALWVGCRKGRLDEYAVKEGKAGQVGLAVSALAAGGEKVYRPQQCEGRGNIQIPSRRLYTRVDLDSVRNSGRITSRIIFCYLLV